MRRSMRQQKISTVRPVTTTTPESVESNQIKTTGRSARNCWRRRSAQLCYSLGLCCDFPTIDSLYLTWAGTWSQRMASRDHWIWHVWLSRNLRQNNSSNLCIETQQKQRDFWSPHVSKLSKSTAWLHVSICNFRTRKDILGCKRRIALCILSSVFEHPLNPEHACTCNLEVNGVGWHNRVFLQFSWQKTSIQTKWPCHTDLKHQQSHLPTAKIYLQHVSMRQTS